MVLAEISLSAEPSIPQKRVYEADINSYNSFVTGVDVQSNILIYGSIIATRCR
jgi:hypothetical protein